MSVGLSKCWAGDLLVEPGATVLQLSTTVTETMISTPMQETDGTPGVTYGGGGVVMGYGGVVVLGGGFPPGMLLWAGQFQAII